MLKKGTFVLFTALMLISFSFTFAVENPRRNSTSVEDVFDPYSADNWIVSPDEETEGDEQSSNAPETDISSVISCYDDQYLRVDILLAHPVSFKQDTCFAVKFEYAGKNEYYTYYPLSKKLVYEVEKNSSVSKTKVLTRSNSKNIAGICDSGDEKNNDVYFFLDKSEHINGEKGKRYYLTTTCFSGFINTSDKLMISDKTITVDLVFGF